MTARSSKSAQQSSRTPRTGRPPLALDEQVIARLAQAGCSVTDIAHVVGCHRDTLYTPRFAELLSENDARGKVTLKVKQHTLALAGDKTMLVWLGKNRLGQTDKTVIEEPPLVVLSDDDVQYRVEQMAGIFEVVQMRVDGAHALGLTVEQSKETAFAQKCFAAGKAAFEKQRAKRMIRIAG